MLAYYRKVGCIKNVPPPRRAAEQCTTMAAVGVVMAVVSTVLGKRRR
jgi:hypothetical protein